MYLPLITLLVAGLLTGCAGIPYEKPEDRIEIQHDLALQAEDIVTITEADWCNYPYGPMAPCRVQTALAVQTKSQLILADYSSKHYSVIMRTQARDVMCAHLQNSIDTSPNFYLFTSSNTLVIWPIKQDNKPDIEKKKRMIDVMVQPGKQAFLGAEGNFVKNTGQYNRGMAIIPGTHVPYVTSEEISLLFNPCTKEKPAQ
ncbi:hypothetical protein AAIM60_08200 [Pseudomonas lijiangensis]|uniref:hypothetical protein n=1 Tax=Pseudomonas lijiangensis TaxID=2995658 RepID=UPI0031BA8E9A